ncbi:MAG: serine/threonine protein kinase [Candidatus Acidiferrales bacterium]
MTEPLNPKPGQPDSPARSGQRQDTVLLSEVPEPSAFIADTSAPGVSLPSLGTANLAALGQRYDILAEAGHGSMGNVYKARDRETGEIVALKLLKPEIASDQAMMDRFKNELLFARKITHKNVCRVHEFNRIGGIAYTSMEFVEGESLRSVLNRFGGLPVRKAISVTQQICSGLKEAHAQGIVHRDLKPENVMIDAQGNVKIMDFGIARSMEALTRLTGSMVGTPAYMAPEQVAGKPVDYRTDIYSLGLMLYEMFTGSQAFQADTAVALALKQLNEFPPPPHEVDPTIPVAIERAILKCLEKEPGKRFQSVAELESALRSQSAAVNPAPASGVPRTHSSHSSTPAPAAAPVIKAEPKRTPALVWVLVGAALVAGSASASRWAAAAKSGEYLPPPARLALPKPPAFAFEIPPATAPSAPVAGAKPAAHSAAHPPPAKPVAHQPAPPSVAKSAPTTPQPIAPAKKTAQPAAQVESPKDVQERADKAFGETESGKLVYGSKILWIGRYQKEERAKAAEKKIKDLGLPVRIVPKRGLGTEAYVVFAGPFPAKRVPSVLEWLKTQGFENVRSLPAPAGNRNLE